MRFGELTPRSRLRTGQVYGIYLRFVGYTLLFGLIAGVLMGIVATMLTLPMPGMDKPIGNETINVIVSLIGYVIIMLGYSTIYQVIVKLRMWRIGFESLELSGLHVLDNVKADGKPSSAFGEGLADALDVGGL
jgi:uncharacterized membrane protein YjgN (DUF898 family)